MKFEQSVNTHETIVKVSRVLDNFEKTASCVPGSTNVKEIKKDTFSGQIEIKLGPMRINLSGEITVKKKNESCHWELQGSAIDKKIGGSVNISINVSAVDPNTDEVVLKIEGEVRFLGRLDLLPKTLVTRKADSILREFALNLNREISDL
jgi:carbon monoxide dehydrogenase subunit G